MVDKVLTQKTALGHTFLNAMWIAGFLAVLQVTAVIYVFYKRAGNETVASTPVSAESQLTPLPITIKPQPKLKKTPAEESLVEPLAKTKDPLLAKLGRSAPDLTEIKDPVGEIDDDIIRGLVDNGRFYRGKQNYSEALKALKSAETELVDHPLVLSEIAGTLGEMGNVEEASLYWTKVTAMGPLIGGEYYNIAARMLNGQNPMTPIFQGGQIVKLGKIREQRTILEDGSQKVVIRIPVFSNPLVETIDGSKMNWDATFYDLINDQTIGRSIIADNYSYPTEPYDWKEDQLEELQATYLMKPNNLGQGVGENRSYAGYGVKLFYQGELQDSVSSSDEISELMFSRYAPLVPVPHIDSSLFPESGNNR